MNELYTIRRFLKRILPDTITNDNNVFAIDPTHRFVSESLENGNYRFNYSALVGEEWLPMSSIEVATGRNFWVGVVGMAKTFCKVDFGMPDKLLAGSVVATLEDAEDLLIEAAGDGPLPKKPVTKVVDLPLQNVGKTRVRDIGDDDDDILDMLQ